MKADLDRLMTERDYDALLVTGSTLHNAPMYYLTGGVHVGASTVLIKARGQTPILFANNMERDEAAKSGLPVVSLNQFRYNDLLKEAKGDALRATGRYYTALLDHAGVSAGRVLLAGMADRGDTLRLAEAVQRGNRRIKLVGEAAGNSLFAVAASTKDADEVRRIRAVGQKTMRVVAQTADLLTSHTAKNGVLVKKDGTRLTIGEVKKHINRWLLDEGIVDAEAGTIFAQGRDAGVPHSRGEAKAPVRVGQTLVFDIFPAEPGGGYFYDFTRTWCVGHAPDHVLAAYETVLGAFKAVSKAFEPNGLCSSYQELVCDYFETRGHATIRQDPTITNGYVHSLGHGLGLHVHESPRLSAFPGNTDTLRPGAVFTVEPGLYYPDDKRGGFGIRLEDTVWLNPATLKFETLAKYPKDLILKLG